MYNTGAENDQTKQRKHALLVSSRSRHVHCLSSLRAQGTTTVLRPSKDNSFSPLYFLPWYVIYLVLFSSISLQLTVKLNSTVHTPLYPTSCFLRTCCSNTIVINTVGWAGGAKCKQNRTTYVCNQQQCKLAVCSCATFTAVSLLPISRLLLPFVPCGSFPILYIVTSKNLIGNSPFYKFPFYNKQKQNK